MFPTPLISGKTRKLDWNNWDWESWNQAKEKCNPLKIVTDSSSQGPLNQIEITSSGLQPDRQYFCRLTELPRLLPGPPDLTATIINVNPSAASSGTLDKNSPSGTLDALNTSDKDDPTGTLAKQAKVSPSDTLNKVDKDSPSVILNKDSKYSYSDTLNKVAKDSSSDTLNKGTKYSPSGTLNIDTEDAPQDYLTRARIALDSAPAALVYAVTCCLPGSEDDSISYVISQDSPVSLSPGTYLNLSWQAMPEASCYNIYRTFSSAGLPCGFLGQTTSNSYQDQGQVIQDFSLPPEIKPSYLIDGDSGYYLFST